MAESIEQIQQKILKDYIQEVINAIKLAQDTASPWALKASGQLQTSMKVLESPLSDKAFLSASSYLSTTFEGVGIRKGIFPFRQIKNWLKIKGITVARDRTTGEFLSQERLAGAIASKIFLEGSAVRRKDRQGVPINKILRAKLPTTGRRLALAYAQDFANDVKQELED